MIQSTKAATNMLSLQSYASSSNDSDTSNSENDSDNETKATNKPGTTGNASNPNDPEALAHLKPISVPEASVSKTICVQAAPDVVPIVSPIVPIIIYTLSIL